MKNRSFLRNMLKVAMSQGVSMLSGVAVGLLLPKALGLEDYGFLKIYTLYVAYTALLHLGFADGILLHLAGKDYESLDKTRMRTYTQFFVAMQSVLGAVLLVAGALVADPDYSFIIAMLGVNMVIINLTTYYQFISQAVQRFSEYSFKNLVVAVLKLLFVAALLVLRYGNIASVDYRFYIIGLNVIDGLVLAWYVATYGAITFGKGEKLSPCLPDIAGIFRLGIMLTVAYQTSHLVLALDRQFVSMFYSTEEYALYSFAYNIITLISTMISSLAIVLLPALRRVSPEEAGSHYGGFLRTVAMLVGLCVLCYFPLTVFIRWFLPEYAESVKYLRLVLPALMYHSGISVVMFTFCKALGENKAFFRISLLTLGIGLLTNALAQMIFATPEAISIASLITMALWYLIAGIRVGKRVQAKMGKEFVYLTVLGGLFLLCTEPSVNNWLGMALYVAAFAVVTAVFYGKFLLEKCRKK